MFIVAGKRLWWLCATAGGLHRLSDAKHRKKKLWQVAPIVNCDNNQKLKGVFVLKKRSFELFSESFVVQVCHCLVIVSRFLNLFSSWQVTHNIISLFSFFFLCHLDKRVWVYINASSKMLRENWFTVKCLSNIFITVSR